MNQDGGVSCDDRLLFFPEGLTAIRAMKILTLACIIWHVLLVSSVRAEDKKPNVLFIAIDDMNDWTGFLGGHPEAKTPHMDKLANLGVNFSNETNLQIRV